MRGGGRFEHAEVEALTEPSQTSSLVQTCTGIMVILIPQISPSLGRANGSNYQVGLKL